MSVYKSIRFPPRVLLHDQAFRAYNILFKEELVMLYTMRVRNELLPSLNRNLDDVSVLCYRIRAPIGWDI
jgi:hypothetical protein